MNIFQESYWILWLTIMPSRQKLGIILENKSFQKMSNILLTGTNNQFRNYESWIPTNFLTNYVSKGWLNSEWIYEVIISPKMPTKNLKDFCPVY